MMEKLKIPPGYKNLRDDDDGNGMYFEFPSAVYCSDEQEFCECLYLSRCGEWRPIIAAVIIVAWTKQALEWDEIEKCGPTTQDQEAAGLEIQNIADQVERWQEWGST